MAKESGYFVVHKKILRLVGLSLEENEKWLYKLYRLLIGISEIIYFIILVLDIFENLDDFDIVIDSLYHAVCYAAVLSKFFLITINNKKLNKTLKMLEQGVFLPNPKRGGLLERAWVEECVKNTNKLIVISCIVPLFALAIPVIASMINRHTTDDSQQWQLPFGRFSTINPTLYPNFELGWSYQMIVFPIAAVIYLATDFLMVGVFSHIAVQFRMLRNSIKSIAADTKNEYINESVPELNSESSWETLIAKLRKNVLYYMAILELVLQFEEIFSMIVLWNYLAMLIAIGCMVYHGSLFAPTDPRFQKDMMFAMALLFQIFLSSYFGNLVTVESQMVLSATYESNFVGTDIRFQKGLCIMMSRSQKPVAFTIGKFSNLSLITFVTVVRVSISYYTMLVSVNTTA